MKKFLYLVQAKADDAARFLKFDNERSDVLILTFDKQLQGPHFIYAPNTIWPQGRNLLIEKARALPSKYEFYIMMDDDVEFVRGSYEEFEAEILKRRPDFCLPFYHNDACTKKYGKINPFPYSALKAVDGCINCFGTELFFDKRLLPYRTDFTLMNSPITAHATTEYANHWFCLTLYEHFWDRRALVMYKLTHINLRHAVPYNIALANWPRFYRRLVFKDKTFSRQALSRVPHFKLHHYRMSGSYFNSIQRLVNARGLPTLGWEIHKPKNLKQLRKLYAASSIKPSVKRCLTKLLWLHFCWQLIHVGRVYLAYWYLRFLWQDLRLNLRIWLKLGW